MLCGYTIWNTPLPLAHIPSMLQQFIDEAVYSLCCASQKLSGDPTEPHILQRWPQKIL